MIERKMKYKDLNEYENIVKDLWKKEKRVLSCVVKLAKVECIYSMY